MNIKTDPNYKVLRGRFLIFLDLETTGLSPQKHEILEIGALKINPNPPFNIVEELEIKVKPTNIKLADKSALKIVGYTDDGWQQSLNVKEALERLDQFAQGGVLVGYNVNFDWAFLDKAYFSLGRFDPFYYHRLDVMPMAYLKLFGKKSLKRFSLGEICKYFKIKRVHEHDALDDAKATYLVFKELMVS